MNIAEMKIIDPETAAHNIATAICNQANLQLPKMDFDNVSQSDVAIQNIACAAAELYAFAYDAAFDKIQKYNDNCEND